MAQNGKEAAMPIAIIGMSCRFAGGASSPERLWELCRDGRSAWSQIPESRFNAASFFHADSTRGGTFNVKGGHFLDGDIALFDASFFNFSAEAARALDPQFRMQLETVYEALENAGLGLDTIAGSDTSVYAGAFFRDHHDALMRDVETMPRLFMTGNGAAMSANRVSHFFDLRGLSITVDTGCSTALAALHLGCQSLKQGEATMSVITAANLMINPDMFISMSSLGFLSPDGKCYAFDARANGYGRGEGVSAVVIKPLQDALRDGDPIRAVIRETALNQDGKTSTITAPSQEAQQELIRRCYNSCGLDPARTPYVEAHGTGTQTGDPIEAAAIGIEFGKGRSSGSPVLIGSVKTNIGHCEAASGLASLIKVVKSIESDRIAPSINYEQPNPKLRLREWNLEVVSSLQPWPDHSLKRASISNFGYGGCNAHTNQKVILEDPAILGAIRAKETKTDSHGTAQTYIIRFSGKDQAAVMQQKTQLAAYLRSNETNCDLAALAYTLNHRRSVFPWRNSAVGRTVDDMIKSLEDPTRLASKSLSQPLAVGMVFTGQGAQWAGMGKELIDEFPVYRRTMVECERVLQSFSVSWSLLDEARKDKHVSRVHEPGMSLVLCTALQVSLINLLLSWGVRPKAVSSHSSGEVAAAYAAGVLTLRDAMAIVFTRMGLSTPNVGYNGETGGMLAAGIGKAAAQTYLDALTHGKAVVACENSPESVTISGDILAIEQVEKQLHASGVFARKLKINVAYHSHHMAATSSEYLEKLGRLIPCEQRPRDDFRCKFYSPVSGDRVHDPGTIDAQHWVQNMTQPVLFSSAFGAMCTDDELDIVIEVGPHGALGGPIRQIQQHSSLPPQRATPYFACMTRGEDAVICIKNLAAELWKRGHDMAPEVSGDSTAGRVLVDLPTYPWTHDLKHWQEPARNRLHRFKKHRSHDLLGALEIDCNPYAPTWRNFLTASSLPWIRDHKVQGKIIYPGAGLVCMAVEAIAQLKHPIAVGSVELSNVNILQALTVPDEETGVEVRLSLRACSSRELRGDGWYDFQIVSRTRADAWMEHCSGSVTAWPAQTEPERCRSLPRKLQTLLDEPLDLFHRRQSPVDFYDGMRLFDIVHGPSFQNIMQIRRHRTSSVCQLMVADTKALMPEEDECPHILHPTTLDNVFQALYTSIPLWSVHAGARVPRSIESVLIQATKQIKPSDVLETRALLHHDQARGFCSSAVVRANDGTIAVVVDRLFCQSIASAKEERSTRAVDDLQLKCIFKPSCRLTERRLMEQALHQVEDDADQKAIIRSLGRAVYHFIRQALGELTPSDVKSFADHQLRFYNWMKKQIKLADLDLLGGHSSSWKLDQPELQQRLFEAAEANSVNGEMTARIGRNLVSILRNEQAPLAVMLETNLLYRYYEQDIRMRRIYPQVSQLVELLAHEKPGSHILEIGAGTGGCTTAVLGALGSRKDGRLGSYRFTDLSSGFFPQARQKFESWGDVISYKKLDIEGDTASQGFEDAQYDGIVACRVLHATRNMTRTMSNVRRLLKSGGWLLLIEDTIDALDTQLAFGVLPGWWLGEESNRQDSPTLPEDQWETLLRGTGYSGIDLIAHDYQDINLRCSSVMLSRRTHSEPAESSEPHKTIRLWHTNDHGVPSPEWLKQVRQRLSHHSVVLSSLESPKTTLPSSASAGDEICVVLDHHSSSHTLLPDAGEERYELIRSILTQAKQVLWVARGGALSSPICEAALHLGLLRTLRGENTSASYVSLDLDPQQHCWSIESAMVLASVLTQTLLRSDGGHADLETECVERDGIVLVPRVLPAKVGGGIRKATLQQFHQSGQPVRLSVGNPGLLDSIYFTHWDPALKPLADDEVDVFPAFFGLNFRDVMVALGQLDTDVMGFECSGVVKTAGSAAGLEPGQRVCVLLRGHWSNSVRVHRSHVAKIPDDMTLQVAATLPMVYITAYCALVETARCRQGQSILIHAAAGGVGQATIKIAQWLKMDIFVTAGTPEKRNYLHTRFGIPASNIFSSRNDSFAASLMDATDQKGVDVILNSVSGPLLQATWGCIARFGHFVEIGKRDIEQNGYLSMQAFARNVSFSSIDLIQIGEFDPPMIQRAFSKIMELLGKGLVEPVEPIEEYPLSKIESAMRLMQTGRHMGKIVLNAEAGCAQVEVVTGSIIPTLSEDATYLIVGGLGGLGLAIIEHLATLGAKSLLVLSRSASSQAKASSAVEVLRAQGCNIQALDCDVADAQSLGTALEWASIHLAPIRGIVQAAMALHDSVFEAMSYSDFVAALRPKLAATYNLHAHFSGCKSLDFFIALSSFTGVGGSVSQANYASGGTYQDALMRHRASLGLPGVCIDLGVVDSVGFVAQTPGVSERLAKLKYRRLQEHEVLELINEAIRLPVRTVDTAQVITGIAMAPASDLNHSGIQWRREPRFRGMVQPVDRSDAPAANSSLPVLSALSSSNLHAELQAHPAPEDAQKAIQRGILHKLSEMFMIPVIELDVSQPLSKYGVDSLVAVELRNWLVVQTESMTTIFDVMQSANTMDLARRAAATSKYLI